MQSSETLIFATDAKETTSDFLAWKCAGPMIVVTQDCIYLYTLQTAVQISGFQSALKLGADSDRFLWNTGWVLAHPQQQRINQVA